MEARLAIPVSDALEKAEYDRMLLFAPPPSAARLRSCGGKRAGAWLTTTPTHDAAKLDNAFFQCMLRRRLGLTVGLGEAECEARSCSLQDDWELSGDHGSERLRVLWSEARGDYMALVFTFFCYLRLLQSRQRAETPPPEAL